MITIDELLAEAQRYAKLAATSTTGDRGMFAQIAQAAATTAQAMILRDLTTWDQATGGPMRAMALTHFYP